MTRLGKGIRANVIASVLFSLMHGLTRDWVTALLVFLPKGYPITTPTSAAEFDVYR